MTTSPSVQTQYRMDQRFRTKFSNWLYFGWRRSHFLHPTSPSTTCWWWWQFDDEFGPDFGVIGNLPTSGANGGTGTALTRVFNTIESHERHTKGYVKSYSPFHKWEVSIRLQILLRRTSGRIRNWTRNLIATHVSFGILQKFEIGCYLLSFLGDFSIFIFSLNCHLQLITSERSAKCHGW